MMRSFLAFVMRHFIAIVAAVLLSLCLFTDTFGQGPRHEPRGFYHDHWYYGYSNTNPYYRAPSYHYYYGRPPYQHYQGHPHHHRGDRHEFQYDRRGGWSYRYSW